MLYLTIQKFALQIRCARCARAVQISDGIAHCEQLAKCEPFPPQPQAGEWEFTYAKQALRL